MPLYPDKKFLVNREQMRKHSNYIEMTQYKHIMGWGKWGKSKLLYLTITIVIFDVFP